MPRQARLDAPGTLHHVIVRGIDGVSIFRDDQDRKNFLSRIADLVSKTGTQILAWALLDNHLHLLLFSGQAGISKFMRCLLTGYAGEYNRKYNRKGHLFQNRFKSIVCEEESYLLELIRYIHLNPLRAGMVRDLAGLDRYPWSGHRALLGFPEYDWQERDYVFRRFAENPRKAMKAYRQFVGGGLAQGRREDLVGSGLVRSRGGWSQVLSLRNRKEQVIHDARILGGEEFVRKVWAEAGQNIQRQLKVDEQNKLIDQAIRKICKQKGVNEVELRNGSQRKDVSKVRAQIAHWLNRHLGISCAEIARHLGVSGTAVIKAIQKMETKIGKL